MFSEKEIYDALKMLQDLCKENRGDCCKCMLRNINSNCGVIYDWNDEARDGLNEIELKNVENPRIILG